MLQQKDAGIDTGMNDYLEYLEMVKEEKDKLARLISIDKKMRKPKIDLVDIKTLIKNGELNVFVKKNKVYIEDSYNEECVLICDLVECEKR